MYLQHYGLAQYPFSLTPNTRYFLKLPRHQEAFNLLLAALEDSSSFAKITGEVGTGKTMLCLKFLHALEFHKNRYFTAYIPHPILSEEGIMHAIADELSLERKTSISYYEILKLITEELISISAKEKRVVLFIDEAQAMPEETLEAVHLLTSAATLEKKLLQVVLFGQPELDLLLNRPPLRQIKCNLFFSYQLAALDRDGLESYVAYRLSKSGHNGPLIFTKNALDCLYAGSDGVPRLINILAHKALMAAYGKGEPLVHQEQIAAAVRDSELPHKKQTLGQKLFAK